MSEHYHDVADLRLLESSTSAFWLFQGGAGVATLYNTALPTATNRSRDGV
jgi:hypothetical protein